MRLLFEQLHAFLSTATKVLVFATVVCLATAFGLAILGFSDFVPGVQQWTFKAAIASAISLALLVIAWISGELARRIEGPASAKPL